MFSIYNLILANYNNKYAGGHELSKTTGNAGARVGCGKYLFYQ